MYFFSEPSTKLRQGCCSGEQQCRCNAAPAPAQSVTYSMGRFSNISQTLKVSYFYHSYLEQFITFNIKRLPQQLLVIFFHFLTVALLYNTV
jgi:hypothetical protein